MSLDRNGLEILSREECMGLLRIGTVGRVVLAEGGVPSAFPVNFGVVGDDIVFRTSTGSKLTAAVRHAVVAFEVDDMDYQRQTGWSILVKGWARLLTRPDEISQARELELQAWAPGQRWHFILIHCDEMSGRRLVPRTVGRGLAEGAPLAGGRPVEIDS
jgi:nitroimidazol reductase NimA-like FMN-containing flavoprotein (pyridoxamine 5'-phosphate oxidase superfamily)